MKRVIVGLLLVATLGLGGCVSADSPPPPTETNPNAAMTTTAPPPPAPKVTSTPENKPPVNMSAARPSLKRDPFAKVSK